MNTEQKYQKALDLLQNLLNSYGCHTPKWEEARKLMDEERPIVSVETTPLSIRMTYQPGNKL